MPGRLPQPGSVPVSAANGDAGGVTQNQPEPGALPEGKRWVRAIEFPKKPPTT